MQNPEVHSQKNKWNHKIARLCTDLLEIFREGSPEIGALFLTEWGNMRTSIDRAFAEGAREGKKHTFPGMGSQAPQMVECKNSQTFFDKLLEHLGLRHIKAVVQPPYIALVDIDRWSIEAVTIERRFCEVKEHCGQHAILRMKDSGAAQPAGVKVRILNVHMPTSMSTDKEKGTR